MSLRTGFLSAVKGSLKQKQNIVIKTILPKYTGLAAAAVTATSFVQVPFSDSVPLMTIQVKMSLEISKIYGIDNLRGELIKSIAQTQLISYLGKTLARQLLGMIPFIGTPAKVVANVGTATTITATLGLALSIIMERYLRECVNANGKENVGFAEFFTSDKLKEAINWITENGQDIIDGIVKKVPDSKSVKKGK